MLANSVPTIQANSYFAGILYKNSYEPPLDSRMKQKWMVYFLILMPHNIVLKSSYSVT